MSHEGLILIARAALVAYLIACGALFRALIGRGPKRDLLMLIGTVAGVALGIFLAYALSPLFGMDASAVFACLGMSLGWFLAWRIARRLPRGA